MPKTPFSDDFSGFLRISPDSPQNFLKTQLIYAQRAENEQSNSLSTAHMSSQTAYQQLI